MKILFCYYIFSNFVFNQVGLVPGWVELYRTFFCIRYFTSVVSLWVAVLFKENKEPAHSGLAFILY